VYGLAEVNLAKALAKGACMLPGSSSYESATNWKQGANIRSAGHFARAMEEVGAWRQVLRGAWRCCSAWCCAVLLQRLGPGAWRLRGGAAAPDAAAPPGPS
jgi:hypothetical protein